MDAEGKPGNPVNRGSTTVASIIPKIALIIPRTSDFPERLDINVRENTPIEKYSTGPNFNATLAKIGATLIRIIRLNMPPRKE
jgi:hypothetical protein